MGTYKVNARHDVTEMLIYDEIGGGAFGGVDAERVVGDIAEAKGRIHARINSPGGNAFDGVAIFNALTRHEAGVDVTIDGVAASAASVIAMAGETITMRPATRIMIHEAYMVFVGGESEFRAMADLMGSLNEDIAGIYAKRTGADVETVRGAMAAETWYTTSNAVEAGFATHIDVDGQAIAACIQDGRYKNTPPEFLQPQGKQATPRGQWQQAAARRAIELT